MNYFDIPINDKEQTIIYKRIKGFELKLMFFPATKKTEEFSPIYFIIPGGGWVNAKPESMVDFSHQSVTELRKKGYSVVSVEYRVYSMSDSVVMDDCISDCFDAVRYICHFSDILKIDKNRIVFSGHSAGGHLALMLAYAPDDLYKSEIGLEEHWETLCVCPMSAITVLSKVNGEYAFSVDSPIIEKNYDDEVREKWSPVFYITKDSPPTLLCVGTNDPYVANISYIMAMEKLKENNVPATLLVSEGGGHCFEEVKDGIIPSKDMKYMQSKIVDFILANTNC